MAKPTSSEFLAGLRRALGVKTLYVMGCIGAPLTAANKARYLAEQAYNRRDDRRPKIEAASSDTFGFDCVCYVKSVLWGWKADPKASYGGAAYASNGVPDIGPEEMIDRCSGVSTDFSELLPGEFLWMPGHCGIYLGDGLAVECTPIWKDGVQVTACNRAVAGYNRRDWVRHGKLPYVDYGTAKAENRVLLWQKAALADGFSFPLYGADGEWGGECEKVASAALVQEWKDGKYRYPALTKLAQQWMGMPPAEQDGLCGPKTTAAIRRCQSASGLTPDGGIGRLTWQALLGI